MRGCEGREEASRRQGLESSHATLLSGASPPTAACHSPLDGTQCAGRRCAPCATCASPSSEPCTSLASRCTRPATSASRLAPPPGRWRQPRSSSPSPPRVRAHMHAVFALTGRAARSFEHARSWLARLPVTPPTSSRLRSAPLLAPSGASHDCPRAGAPQVFPMPADLPVGRYLRVNLHGKRQRQLEDMQASPPSGSGSSHAPLPGRHA